MLLSAARWHRGAKVTGRQSFSVKFQMVTGATRLGRPGGISSLDKIPSIPNLPKFRGMDFWFEMQPNSGSAPSITTVENLLCNRWRLLCIVDTRNQAVAVSLPATVSGQYEEMHLSDSVKYTRYCCSSISLLTLSQ